VSDPLPDAPATGRLVRSSAVVGLGTGLSRLTGLLRVAALTYALGATLLSDAYNLANTTPNIVYELILGGILSATLVPVFVENHERDDDDSTSAVLSVAFVVLLGLTVAAIVAAPWIVRLYTLRLDPAAAAEQEAVAVPLLRLFLPQILFYGLTALGTALLNSRRRFAVPAFAPVLNNVIVIAVMLAVPRVAKNGLSISTVRNDSTLLLLLGLGTTAGIVAMTLVLWPAIRAAHIKMRWRLDWRNRSVITVARLSGWTVGYAIANQLALFAVLALANGSGAGDVSAYTYAFIFFQLPHGLFAVSIMTAFMPDLSSFASRGDFGRYRDRFALGFRLLALVILPAAVGYVLLARPLVSVLLERGAFNGADAVLTGDVLSAFALGLLGFSVYLYVLRGFYTLKDTRTPFFVNLGENGLNVVLAFALVGRLGVQGLALAYAAAYTVSAVVAAVLLRRRIGGFGGAHTASSLARIGAATATMAGVVWLIVQTVGSESGSGALLQVGAAVVAGVAVYAAALLLLRVDDVTELVAQLRSRRRGVPAEPAE